MELEEAIYKLERVTPINTSTTKKENYSIRKTTTFIIGEEEKQAIDTVLKALKDFDEALENVLADREEKEKLIERMKKFLLKENMMCKFLDEEDMKKCICASCNNTKCEAHNCKYEKGCKSGGDCEFCIDGYTTDCLNYLESEE